MTLDLDARRVVRGQRVARAKLERVKVRRRGMTFEERLLWQRLRRSQLGGLHFHRPQVIDGFIVDSYCVALGLVVEVDGFIHDAQPDYDAERDKILAACGLHVLRVTNEDVKRDINPVLTRILAHASATMFNG
jgi:very-short-patch-repair endonuclease